MATWILLLRGINVGGKNRLPMKELVQELETLKLTNIKTYIQSGNVTFEASEALADGLGDRITTAIEASHGFRPRCLILSAEALGEAIAANPFPEAEAEPKTLHLYFLSSVPESPNLEAIEQAKAPSEAFQLIGKVFYLHAPMASVAPSWRPAQRRSWVLRRRLAIGGPCRSFRRWSKWLNNIPIFCSALTQHSLQRHKARFL